VSEESAVADIKKGPRGEDEPPLAGPFLLANRKKTVKPQRLERPQRGLRPGNPQKSELMNHERLEIHEKRFGKASFVYFAYFVD
jgi:hypothetical protein